MKEMFKTFHRKLINQFILIGYLLLLTLPSVASGTEYLTAQELLSDLQVPSVDKIRKTLNTARQMRYQGEILPILYAVWERNKKKYPDLPWAILDMPIVRVDLANVLMQAERNGRITFDKKQMHEYVASFIESSDVDVAATAIWTIEFFDDAGDVPKILSVAKKQHKITFPMAVIALTSMCNPAADSAVNELLDAVTDSDRRRYIIETRKDMSEYNSKTAGCPK